MDPTDAVVPDSKISFLSGVVQRYAYSNELGAFEIWLPAGDYEVEIEDNRFKKYSLKRLELTTRVAKELRINLEFLPYPICILTVSTGGERIEQKPAPLSEKITARKIQ